MEEIDLKELLLVYWKKKWFVAIVTLISIAIGYYYSYYHVVPKYESTTTLMLGKISNFSSDSTEIRDDYQITQSEITINSSLVSTYSKLITSRTLVQKVIANLNLNISEGAIIGSTIVSRVEQTQLIQIRVRNTNPELACKIANEIAKVFSDQIKDIYNINNVYIVDQAIPSGTPYNINHKKDLGISALIGFVLSSGLILLYYLLDNTVKSEEQLEENIGVKNLINIPLEKKQKNKISSEIIAYSDPKSIISETFRTLRTNVQFSNTNSKDAKTFLITSCFQSEGKSYVSANLAITFAQVGKKVILVDADMRKGRQHEIFEVNNNNGLSNYLIMTTKNDSLNSIGDYIQTTLIDNLYIMTAGMTPPNPSELLTSQKMIDLIKYLEQIFDIVIFDGTPSTIVTDAIILSKFVDSTLIVSAHKETKIDDLNQVKRNITNVGGRIAGVVVNKMPVNKKVNKAGYYYENSIVTSKRTWGINTKQTPKKKIEDAEINAVKRKLNEVEKTKEQSDEKKQEEVDINAVLQQLSQYLESDKK